MYQKNRLCTAILGTMLCFSLHADEGQKNCTTTKEKKPLMREISLYETRDNDGVNIGVRGDVLYMNYSFPEVTFAAENFVTTHVDNSLILAPSNKMSVGFDVAINYTMENSPEYMFELRWFNIKPKWESTVTSDILLPSHIFTLDHPTPGTGTNTASISLNFIDLTLSKAFSFGKFVSFVPMVGILGGLFDGHNNASFTASSGSFYVDTTDPRIQIPITQVALDQHVQYKGLGAKIGTGYGFDIWKGFGIVGELSANLLYGFSKVALGVSENSSILSPIPQTGNVQYFHHHGLVFLDSLLGLSWKSQFADDYCFLDLHAGWRMQAFYPGWTQIEAETNDAMTEHPFFGQGLEAGVTFKF